MPMLANSDVSYAKTKLPYPIYSADFDPYRRGYLVVGGGGGESSTGISNQISLLDVSDRRNISTAAEIDLSSTEDSVSSLGNLATRDGLIALAGINSSTADQKSGKNEHLRAFDIRYPPRKKAKTEKTAENTDAEQRGGITLLGKRSFFRPSPPGSKEQTYQRLLRLSPARKQESGSKRIGAIATGLAKDSQIIVFNATVAPPEDADILARIDLPARSEAADLDIIQTENGEYSLAYCDDFNIYEQTFEYDFTSKKTTSRPRGPRRVHQMALPDTTQSITSRPKFRCLRFLNENTVLALVNKANKKGAELRIYHLYPTGPAMEVTSKTLPSRIKQAASMDVCALDADAYGNQQVAVAVAGQDVSIEVFTANYSGSTETFSSLKSYLTMSQVHDQGMTQICFEPFHSPVRAPDPTPVDVTDKAGKKAVEAPATVPQHPGPQYIRLASVSYANTVVVETFPLSPLEPKNKDSRYVLSHPKDESFWFWAYAIVISFVVLVTAFLVQSVLSPNGDPQTGLLNMLPAQVQAILNHGRPRTRITESVTQTITVELASATQEAPEVATATIDLRQTLLDHHATPEDAALKAVVVRNVPEGDGLDIGVHADKEEYLVSDPHAKHWHDLDDDTKSYWRQKLKAAGQWAEHEGEAVFKGVLWSTYAGFVGQVGGEILREL